MKQGKGYKILPREHTEEQKGEAFIRWLLTVIGQGKPHWFIVFFVEKQQGLKEAEK